MIPRLCNWILFSVIGAIFATAYGFVFYAQPLADDFCRSFYRETLSPVLTLYLNWTGRWASNLVEVILLSEMQMPEYFWLVLSFLWVGILIGYSSFFKLVFQDQLSNTQCLMLGVCFFVLFFTGAPQPGDTLYWGLVTTEYQFSFGIIFLALTAIQHEASKGVPSITKTILLSLGIIFACGFHEFLSAAFGLQKLVIKNARGACFKLSNECFL